MACLLLGLSLMLIIPTSVFSSAQYSIASENQVEGNGQMSPTLEPEDPPRAADFAMKVQLEPQKFFADLKEQLEQSGAFADLGEEFELGEQFETYEVSDFALVVSNSSELCPTSNCEFYLDGGRMLGDVTLEERILIGKLKVNTGDSTNILNMYTDWQAVEELEHDEGTVQVVEGTFRVGNEKLNFDYLSRINGTLATDGDKLLLEVNGTRK